MNTQVIEVEETMLTLHCILPCTNCGTWTKHVLSRSKEFYSCQCGEIIDVEIKEKENE